MTKTGIVPPEKGENVYGKTLLGITHVIESVSLAESKTHFGPGPNTQRNEIINACRTPPQDTYTIGLWSKNFRQLY